ncbi:MAG TPA: DUF4395 domain-containing protein [Acidimicrobiales bacterium]|nr:DUF4395 domain-containing protein [Acidimicrobiales bacterium]
MALPAFPRWVNDAAARTVAVGVVVMAALAATLPALWLAVPLAYGFAARVLAGPRLSPLALLATRVVAPRLGRHAKLHPGPPKRFAQAIGCTFSSSALALWLAGEPVAARALLGALAVPALLEAAIGYCVGCQLFGLAMRLGLVPPAVCLECADLSRRAGASVAG